MHIEIGPYILSRRTEYSKFQLFDRLTKKNISIENEDILKKMIEDYNRCTDGSVFEINANRIDKFSGKVNIEYLFIPEGITHIVSEACMFSNIKYIHFPNSLTTLGHYAFKGCERLEEVNFPNTFKELFNGVFCGCTSLKTVILPDGLESIPPDSFHDCELLEDIYIPNTVKKIETSAFSYCKSLKKINMPSNIESFGRFIFVGSTAESLVFNFDTTSEKKITFESELLQDANIHKIEISGNVTKLNQDFFKNSGRHIKKIEYHGTKQEFEKFKKENRAFLRPLHFAKVIIKKDLDTISNTTKNIEINDLER